MTSPETLDLDSLDFAKGQGLVTVVAQDARTGAVLMVAHADREALSFAHARALAQGRHERQRAARRVARRGL
jgi:phosphoribosyl-AMP cyclohydrolase / phosphoribosyl-ATP pyrophosphohydrolase